MATPLWSNLVGIKLVQNANFDCASEKVFGTDCFRWPEGPAETLEYARRKKGKKDHSVAFK